MNKKVLMGLALLALVGASIAFAQAPTMDKLRFQNVGNTTYNALPLNTSISGAVVIPATHEGLPVTIAQSTFQNCTGITSVVIPNGVTTLGLGAFRGCTSLTSATIPASISTMQNLVFEGCTNLTSVTFLGVTIRDTWAGNQFPGDLLAKYKAGGAGTYTRPAGSNTWTKQGGAAVCEACGRPF